MASIESGQTYENAKGAPIEHPSLETVEGRQELAERLFYLAEDVGKMVEQLRNRAERKELTSWEVLEASVEIRREVFSRSCEVLGISSDERAAALHGEVG